jgi:pimeloyl-ACP methyl ester carboxylesterase
MMVPLQTGERLHYLEWDGDPAAVPIVLVHGATRTAWTWLPVARRLSATHPVVAVDLRGHGTSDAPREGYDLESLALDVLTIVAAKGWGEAVDGPPVVVAGHGFGAMVAATMAVVQPASIAGLGLVDGGWEEVADATRMSPSELLTAIADPPEVLASVDIYLADRREFDPDSWDFDQETAARAQVDEKHAGHVALVTKASVQRRLVDAMFSYRPTEVLGAIDRPMLVFAAGTGAADDDEERERGLALEDLQVARGSAGRGPASVRRFDGIGHDLMRYRPDEVATELAAFAESLPPP